MAVAEEKVLITLKTNNMKNSNRFLIGFITAAFTFSILLLTLGPRRFDRHQWRHCQQEKQLDKTPGGEHQQTSGDQAD